MKKKIIIGILASSFLFATQAFVEVESSKDLTPQEVTTVASHKVDVTADFSIKKESIVVGEGDTIKVNPIYGVTPKGTFQEIKNDDIHVKTDGSFTVLKEGTIEIIPIFTLSEDSLSEIKQAYIKENKLTGATEADIMPYTRDIARILIIEGLQKEEREKVNIDVTPTYEIDKEEVTVGETAKLSVKPIQGIEITGTFSKYENEFLKIATDGTITGIKANESPLILASFELSEQSQNDIFEAYKKNQEMKL